MSVRSLNKVMLIGNLTRDPNMRYTPTGTGVCSFSIATNRSWTPSDGGEKQEKADYHNIVAWTKLAEVCAQLLHKGDKVYVEGRMQTREWQNKEGQDQRTTEVVIDNMILLNSRSGASMTGAGAGDMSANEDVSMDAAGSAPAPAKKKKKSAAAETDEVSDMSEGVSEVEDISEDVDIPF
jgi:single-strand DNA-binding protein